jgi:DNA-binding PadR family transcriptional regulator
MPERLSYTAALLETTGAGDKIGLRPDGHQRFRSGTVYPILRRLKPQGLIKFPWGTGEAALADRRPARPKDQPAPEGRESLGETVEGQALLSGFVLCRRAAARGCRWTLIH